MTQHDMILNHIDTYGSITPMEAMKEYGIMRLASRIHDLRSQGINIEGEFVEGENRFGEKVRYMSYRRAV